MRFDNSPPVFRFAPSPNGALHLGHAYSAILNYELAKKSGGRFLVRVEDIDQTRCSPELEKAMLDDLEWLGLEWETPVRRQSEHFSDYQEALARLEAQGLVYRSRLSRGQIKKIVDQHEEKGKAWPRDPDGVPLFPGWAFENRNDTGARRNGDDPLYALRLDMNAAIERVGSCSWSEMDGGGEISQIIAQPAAWGDVVLAGRGALTSYHVAVVVDDALQGITHIVRGRDLFHATSVHVLLRALLGLAAPVYHHHPLIFDDEGEKLSKSKQSQSLESLRSSGVTPQNIRHMVGL